MEILDNLFCGFCPELLHYQIMQYFKVKPLFVYDLIELLLSLLLSLFSDIHSGEFDLELTSELIDLNEPHVDPRSDPWIEDVGVSKL